MSVVGHRRKVLREGAAAGAYSPGTLAGTCYAQGVLFLLEVTERLERRVWRLEI